MVKLLRTFIEYWIRNIPSGVGRRIRYMYYKQVLGSCGKNVLIDIGVVIENPQSVFLEDDIWLDNYVIILAGRPKDNARKIFRKENPDYVFREGELHISKYVHIAPFSVIQCHGGVSIGENSGIAAGSKIYSLSNHYKNLLDSSDTAEYHFTPLGPLNKQAYILSPVVIKQNAALGLNSTVLPGTTIPQGTWVGVNTVMQGRKFLENGVYATEPGKFVKHK